MMVPRVSMVINNFHVGRPSISPYETNAPLIVDAYGVLSLAVPLQGFETIGRRNPQVNQAPDVVQHPQFSTCRLLNFGRQAPRLQSTSDASLCLPGP